MANRSTNPKAMTSIALSEETVAPYLDEVMNRLNEGKIAIGCINSPKNVTVTGMNSYCLSSLVRTLLCAAIPLQDGKFLASA